GADEAVELSGLTLPELERFVTEKLGERPFRARQIYRWIHQRAAVDFEEMTGLSKELRRRLKERASIATLRKDLELRAADGTIKYRFQTSDGKLIEAVYMPAEDRRTLCVSTQAGCAMACTFCMTATLGLQRHLTAGEIVAQVNWVNGELARAEGGPRPTPPPLSAEGGGRTPCQSSTTKNRPPPYFSQKRAQFFPTATSPSRRSAWCR